MIAAVKMSRTKNEEIWQKVKQKEKFFCMTDKKID